MTKPRNDGKSLEQLVKLVEGMDLPPGFMIEHGKRIYNDDGIQIAELDILISGFVGTVNFSTLFECRNRPSDGPADGAWIQQLAGRRQARGVRTVVAVSTTGFSPGAIQDAKTLQVELRSVEDLTEEQLRGFLPPTAPLVHNIASPERIQLHLAPENVDLSDPRLSEKKQILSERGPMATHDECVVELKTGKKMTVPQLWDLIRDRHQPIVFHGVPYSGEGVHRTLDIPWHVFQEFRVLAGEERLQIVKMIVVGNFQRSQSQIPLTMAVNYGPDTDRPTVVATWKSDTPEHGVHEIMVVLQKRRDQSGT